MWKYWDVWNLTQLIVQLISYNSILGDSPKTVPAARPGFLAFESCSPRRTELLKSLGAYPVFIGICCALTDLKTCTASCFHPPHLRQGTQNTWSSLKMKSNRFINEKILYLLKHSHISSIRIWKRSGMPRGLRTVFLPSVHPLLRSTPEPRTYNRANHGRMTGWCGCHGNNHWDE